MANPKDTTSGDVTPRPDQTDAEGDKGDGPSSHETSGAFPAQEVRQTFPGTGTDPQANETDEQREQREANEAQQRQARGEG